MAATKRKRHESPDGRLECYVCKRYLPRDAFLTITVRDKRCKPGHTWTGPSRECRHCRSVAKREARAREAGFPTWEAWQAAKSTDRISQRSEGRAAAEERAIQRSRALSASRERARTAALAVLALAKPIKLNRSNPKPSGTPRKPPRLADIPTPSSEEITRFRGKHLVTDTGCWEWTGERSRSGGYGVFTFYRAGQTLARVASRVAWVIDNGEVPDGLFVLHRCDNPPCVNPEHLFVGTHDDNMADMVAKGRSPDHGTASAENRRKTRCPKCGGDFVTVSLPSQLTAKGHPRRRCLRCKAEAGAEYAVVWKAKRLVGGGG